MEYVTETLDRATGDLEVVSMGNFVTVTEFCKKMGAGSRQGRAVLGRMGLLAEETNGKTTRWRLTREAVTQGLGKRHDKPKIGKYPFDVLSPKGQAWAAKRWAQTEAQIKSSLIASPDNQRASIALSAFKAQRRGSMTEQMEVCWLLDHHPSLGVMDISRITGVPKQSVTRYAAMRSDSRDALLSQREAIQRSLKPGSIGDRYWLGTLLPDPSSSVSVAGVGPGCTHEEHRNSIPRSPEVQRPPTG